jgi:hypothetical protein
MLPFADDIVVKPKVPAASDVTSDIGSRAASSARREGARSSLRRILGEQVERVIAKGGIDLAGFCRGSRRGEILGGQGRNRLGRILPRLTPRRNPWWPRAESTWQDFAAAHAAAKSLVAKGGIEPPTQGFSERLAATHDRQINNFRGRPLRLSHDNAALCTPDSRKTHARLFQVRNLHFPNMLHRRFDQRI